MFKRKRTYNKRSYSKGNRPVKRPRYRPATRPARNNDEIKSLNTSFSLIPQITTTATPEGAWVSNLTEVAQGTADNQRIGRKIFIKNVRIRGDIGLNYTFGVGEEPHDTRIRIMLVLDKQNNGNSNARTFGDIYDTTEGTLTVPNSIPNYLQLNSFTNLDNVNRYQILYDKIHCLKVERMAIDGTGTHNINCLLV